MKFSAARCEAGNDVSSYSCGIAFSCLFNVMIFLATNFR